MAQAQKRLRFGFPGSSLVQSLLALGYLCIVAVCFLTPIGPRLFWTILLPLLPISIVIMGFYAWRRICPLAYWGAIGVRLKPKGSTVRRVPDWMERWFYLVAGGFLMIMLVVRLLVFNGDGAWLGFVLLIFGVLAAATNFTFSGKTWCNFICPVGLVERIYTEPNSL